jgi:hypothetical protein
MPASQHQAMDVTPPHVKAVAPRRSPVATGRAGVLAAVQAQAGNRAVAALLSRSGSVQQCGGQPNGACDNDTAEVQRPSVQPDAVAATKLGRASGDLCSPLHPAGDAKSGRVASRGDGADATGLRATRDRRNRAKRASVHEIMPVWPS